MDKAALHGLTFKRDVELDGHPEQSPVCDSYAEFVHGAYKLATRGKPFYRPIGDDPARSSGTTLRYTINETIDGSVFDRWRANSDYRSPNLTRWAEKYKVDPSNIAGAVIASEPRTNV
jgi:hypothetical protein